MKQKHTRRARKVQGRGQPVLSFDKRCIVSAEMQQWCLEMLSVEDQIGGKLHIWASKPPGWPERPEDELVTDEASDDHLIRIQPHVLNWSLASSFITLSVGPLWIFMAWSGVRCRRRCCSSTPPPGGLWTLTMSGSPSVLRRRSSVIQTSSNLGSLETFCVAVSEGYILYPAERTELVFPSNRSLVTLGCSWDTDVLMVKSGSSTLQSSSLKRFSVSHERIRQYFWQNHQLWLIPWGTWGEKFHLITSERSLRASERQYRSSDCTFYLTVSVEIVTLELDSFYLWWNFHPLNNKNNLLNDPNWAFKLGKSWLVV